MQYRELVECFFLLLKNTKSATAKFIEIICFCQLCNFHLYLIQIYFESKYLKKL